MGIIYYGRIGGFMNLVFTMLMKSHKGKTCAVKLKCQAEWKWLGGVNLRIYKQL